MPSIMSQISDPKIAFAYLRPACVRLTREPVAANVETLRGQLKDVDDATLQQLQEYVLFPLRFVLKVPGPRKDRLVQAVAEAMAYVLENTCVRSWDTLRELFSELCLCLGSPSDPGKPADTSEELKLAVLRCLDALLHAAYGDIVFRLYEPVMLPGLGAAVSLLLALAEKEKSRDIQAAALKFLQALTLQCDCAQDHVSPSAAERRSVGDTMASFLPGVTTAVARIITGDLRQGHAVTVRAIKVWCRCVGLVMEDSQLLPTTALTPPSSDLGRLGQLLVRRTDDWVKNTAGRLSVLLKKIISCTSAHLHWTVRLELVELADLLLAQCAQSLRESAGPLLEALVGAINDDHPRVRDRCKAALRDVSRRSQRGDNHGGDRQTFTDVLSENLHALATSLPRLMRTSDDQKKLFVLSVFLGYLKVLGPLVSVVLNSAVHLERISKALMQVLELDVMDVRIVEERSSSETLSRSSDLHDSFYTHTQRKSFLYFRDEKIFCVLMEICRTLGYYGDVYLLSDHVLDLYRQSSAYRKQAAMVLNEVVRGAAGVAVATQGQRPDEDVGGPSASKEDLRAAVVSIMEEYTSLNNWHLITVSEETDRDRQDRQLLSPSRLLSISSSVAAENRLVLHSAPTASSSSTSTVHQLNSNIWQLCIQLEGVACFAQALGRDFRPLLMAALYPLLEKAGEETLLVSEAALNSMMDVSQACGYSSLKQLINDNSDYLLNDVSLNLQRLSQHPQAPRVLTVMLTHSDCSLLPLVGDIVQDVLLTLDLSYDRSAALFCSVLLALMKALARWFPSTRSRINTSAGPRKPSAEQQEFNIREFLLDYRKQKELAEGVGIEEDDSEDLEVPPPSECEDVDDIGGPDVKAELPLHLSVTKDVMERCVHLLSDPDLRLRLKVLELLELCVQVLSEREDELLPMAHRCWPALLHRLTADDPLAVLRAFRVLCTLGETCGDFLRRRVSKEVLPKLTSSLSRQAATSAKAGPVYTHTLNYKLQLAVLQGLGALCQRLDLGEADLDVVCEACLPYLSCRQPPRLQEACLSVFRHLIQLDPDLFWFTLSELHCPRPSPYVPPHPDLPPVQLSGAGRPRDELSDNVLKLLREEFGPETAH
ncbi:LOW QUALITY PROTEIN: TELO2-interacting protein 1 homolog [Cololabis saira]|uniref:LOW QUALITY PROTEIN: TELO2-interacting protein 1 homolog n=1 Tax=Cololabis saira TaxID=129043 RepID=UPI002AD4048D|nr:LOW QUALITY PROTEIN: TELO2-interacting protein 1 homolog [Cololabis saira]